MPYADLLPARSLRSIRATINRLALRTAAATRRRPARLAAALFASVFAGSGAHAATYYWKGTGTTASWTVGSNWSATADGTGANAVPGSGDVATFSSTVGSLAPTVTLDADQSAAGLATANQTITTTLTGGGTNHVLTLGASGINHTSGGLVVGSATAGQQVALSLTAAQSWTSSSGTGTGGIQVLNGVSLASTVATNQLLTLTGTNTDAAVGGVIANGGNGTATLGVNKTGTGTWVLGGLNTYTGVTTVGGGTLSVNTLADGGQASSIGNSSNLATNLVLSGGTLSYTGGTTSTDRNITLNGAVNAGVGGIQVVNGGTTLTLSGTFTGGRDFVKSGPGTLTLTGGTMATPSAFGQLFMQAGTTNISGFLNTSSKFVVQSNGTTNWTGTGTQSGSYAGIADGSSGTLNVTAGALTLSPTTATFIGNSSNGGTGTFAVGLLAVSGGTVTVGASTPIRVGNSYNASNASIGGSGTLTVSGTGTFTTGTTTGLFTLGATPSASTTPGTINLDGGTLATGRAITRGGTNAAATATFNFNGGTLQATGTGLAITGLSLANVRNGGAFIDANTFAVAIAQPLAHSNVGGDAATDGGLTLVANAGGSVALTGSLTFNGGLTVNGGGTLSAAGRPTCWPRPSPRADRQRRRHPVGREHLLRRHGRERLPRREDE